MKYIIGNWKANKNADEVQKWIAAFKTHDLAVLEGQVEVIICPPFPFLPLLHEAFKEFDHIKLGAQDISQFGAGQYTGEVAAHSLDGLVQYVLVGHSERRRYFQETDRSVELKVEAAQSGGIEPIVLVRGPEDQIPLGVKFVGYEPVDAIGTGDTESLPQIQDMRNEIGVDATQVFIYGGSVKSHNVRDLVSAPEVDGVLPGGASLDPEEFYTLIERCLHL